MLCPICEKGQLTEHTELNTVFFNGEKKQVKSKYSVCDYCKSEQSNSVQLNFNKEQVKKLRNS
jgi:hypothetical protein